MVSIFKNLHPGARFILPKAIENPDAFQYLHVKTIPLFNALGNEYNAISLRHGELNFIQENTEVIKVEV